MTRQELNEKIIEKLGEIREDVNAYAEQVGCEYDHLSISIWDNFMSAFAISGEHDEQNVYLVNVCSSGEIWEPCSSNQFFEEVNHGQNVSAIES